MGDFNSVMLLDEQKANHQVYRILQDMRQHEFLCGHT